jgi:hypothetical protein
VTPLWISEDGNAQGRGSGALGNLHASRFTANVILIGLRSGTLRPPEKAGVADSIGRAFDR